MPGSKASATGTVRRTITLPADLDQRLRLYLAERQQVAPAERTTASGLMAVIVDRFLRRRGFGPDVYAEDEVLVGDDRLATLEEIEDYVASGRTVAGLVRDAGLSASTGAIISRWRGGAAPSPRIRRALARALDDRV